MRVSLLLLIFFFVSIGVFGAESTFDVKLIPVVSDFQLDFWFYIPHNSGPQVPMVSTVYQSQPFLLMMPARVTPVKDEKNVEITFDIKLIAPDGKVVLTSNDQSHYTGPIPGNQLLLPKNEIAEMAFDNSDPPGKYTIETIFYEKISKRIHKTSVEIELLEFKEPEQFTSAEELGDWVMQYFLHPDPVRSFSAISYMVQTTPEWIEENYMMLAFFRRVFLDNPFLWEYYLRVYKTSSNEDKIKMLTVAAVIPAEKEKRELLTNLSKEMKSFYEEMKKISIPDTQKQITSAVQLDILWAEFFASGTYDPIKKIVETLKLKKQSNAMLLVTAGAAEWSLQSNCRQFRRVHQYCITAYERESLEPEVKESLGAILEQIEGQGQR